MSAIQSPAFLPSFLLPCLFVCLTACAGDEDRDPEDPNTDCEEIFYADTDGDGYGDSASSMTACEAPVGFVDNSDDCNDASSDAYPGASEICDGLDNDCNNLVDTADPGIDLSTARSYFRDLDGDGFGDPEDAEESCDQPVGRVVDNTDCNDNNDAVYPSATEVCDGFDNNCDNLSDDADPNLDISTTGTYFVDADNDGFGVGEAMRLCNEPAASATEAGDCNDNDDRAFPGGAEFCDTVDNDCDGTTDAPLCSELAGEFSGTYFVLAQERLGQVVINTMRCSGEGSVVVDLSADPVVQGNMQCSHSGSGLFDSTQVGIIEGSLTLDGEIQATLRHTFNDVTRTYVLASDISEDQWNPDGMGNVLPHPMSAVPWVVNVEIRTNRVD